MAYVGEIAAWSRDPRLLPKGMYCKLTPCEPETMSSS